MNCANSVAVLVGIGILNSAQVHSERPLTGLTRSIQPTKAPSPSVTPSSQRLSDTTANLNQLNASTVNVDSNNTSGNDLSKEGHLNVRGNQTSESMEPDKSKIKKASTHLGSLAGFIVGCCLGAKVWEQSMKLKSCHSRDALGDSNSGSTIELDVSQGTLGLSRGEESRGEVNNTAHPIVATEPEPSP